MRGWRNAVVRAGLGLGLLGCGGAPARAPDAPAGPAPASMRLRVETTEHTNGGNPLYSIVRQVDAKGALPAESYQDAAARLFTVPPDPTVAASEPVIPGAATVVDVDVSTSKGLLLYFLFTSPGPTWRVQVRPPFPKVLVVSLGPDQVHAVERR